MRDGAFIHALAEVEPSALIGPGTRIWAFAHVVNGASIGNDCNVCDHTFIEGGVKIGNRVTIKCGVYLWKGLLIEDDVFIGPCAAFTNDLRPRSKQYPPAFLETKLKQGCSVGANATILPGITIGRYAMIGAGSVVTKDVPDYALMFGTPARLKGWICACGNALEFHSNRETVCIACEKRFSYQTDFNTITECTGNHA